jgi:hypothetical protein
MDLGPLVLEQSRKAAACRRTAQQKRQAISVLLKQDPARSDRSIAQELAVGRELISQVRRELTASHQIESNGQRNGSDGKRYHVQPHQYAGSGRYARSVTVASRRIAGIALALGTPQFAKIYEAASIGARAALHSAIVALAEKEHRLRGPNGRTGS